MVRTITRAVPAGLLLIFLWLLLPGNPPRPATAQGQTKLVLAFYYAWYNPSSFGPGKTPFQPLQPYSSGDAGTIQRHVGQAQSAGIDGFVQSWYGPNEPYTNGNFSTLLNIASASGFKAAVDFEPAAFYGSHDERAAGLQSLLQTHATHPAYLRVDGKPVIFFWANWLYSVEDWAYIRSIADPNNSSIWIAEGGNTAYLAVFDGLHLYNTAWSANPAGTAATWAGQTRAAAQTYGSFKYWVATAMPGFDDRLLGRGNASVYRDRADGAYYQSSFAGAAASSPDMLIITSFNEWAEGSHIEPSVEFGTLYLDLTAQMAATYKAGGIPAAPPVQNPTQPPPAATTPGTIPAETPVAPAATNTPPAVANNPDPVASPTPGADGAIIYLAQPGDSLYAIAGRFGLTAAELSALNNYTEQSVIRVGDPVIIGYADPAGVRVADAAAGLPAQNVRADGAIIHIIQSGDTPLGIAATYGLTLQEFYDLNGMTEASIIRPGDEVIVGYQLVPQSFGGSSDLPLPTATPTIAASPTIKSSVTPVNAPPTPTTIAVLPSVTAPVTELAAVAPTATPSPVPTADPAVSPANEPAAAPVGYIPLAAGAILFVAGAAGIFLLRRRQ